MVEDRYIRLELGMAEDIEDKIRYQLERLKHDHDDIKRQHGENFCEHCFQYEVDELQSMVDALSAGTKAVYAPSDPPTPEEAAIDEEVRKMR